MSKAARRRKKLVGKDLASGNQIVTLANPVSHQFGAFIIGNATKQDDDPAKAVVQQHSARGETLILCGAGPSLAEHAAEWCHKGDQVWGCNSALTYLHDRGYKVTHGFTVDQTANMLEEWASAPPAEYLCASSCHPHLVEYLQGKGRHVRFFHNYVGIKEKNVSYWVCTTCNAMYEWDVEFASCKCGGELDRRTMMFEDWMYSAIYPGTIRAGSGLNSVNRALDVAQFMGFAKVIVLGADCALKVTAPKPDVPAGSATHIRWLTEGVVMHADGGHALTSGATMKTLGGTIDGRHWETKFDLIISAVWLVKQTRNSKGWITVIGDTLPNALMDKPNEYLDRLPTMIDNKGRPIMVPDMEIDMAAQNAVP